MTKFAIVVIVGVLALAATSDIGLLEWSSSLRKSVQALISLLLVGASLIVLVSKNYDTRAHKEALAIAQELARGHDPKRHYRIQVTDGDRLVWIVEWLPP